MCCQFLENIIEKFTLHNFRKLYSFCRTEEILAKVQNFGKSAKSAKNAKSDFVFIVFLIAGIYLSMKGEFH